MAKNCKQCKQMIDAVHFIKDDKVYAKCTTCRLKLVRKRDVCKVCGIRARFNNNGEKKGILCLKHKEPQMVDVLNKKCEKCRKVRPVYNFEGKKSGKYCFNCKEENMIDVTSKICISCKKQRAIYNNIEEKHPRFCKNCKSDTMIYISLTKCQKCKIKQPVYNYERNLKPKFCGDCREENMINVNIKLCQKCNMKCRSYNTKGELIALFCKDCKEPDMVNIKVDKCKKCDIKIPSFNFEGMTKAILCGDCKENGMINVTILKKMCIKCLQTMACYNNEMETDPKYCNSCKEPDMINVISRKCIENKCRKNAYYAQPGVLPQYCFLHKKEKMMKLPRRLCIFSNCKDIATYGLTEPQHCEVHASENEYSLTESTCIKCGKIDILNKSGLCINICDMIDRDNKIKKRIKKHEEFIKTLLQAEIDIKEDVIQIWEDKIIDSTCTLKRPDFAYHCGKHVIIIEVDEDQHLSYNNCGYTKDEKIKGENRRMYEIGNIFQGIPIIFIRYNPDNFKDNTNKKVIISNIKRHDILIRWVKKCIRQQWDKGLYVKYLFYDNYDETDVQFLRITEENVL